MCRIFAYRGDSEQGLEALYKALVSSAKNDTRSTKKEHRDGWGYVIYSGDRLYHYRTAKPIFEDNHTLPKLSGNVAAIFHARRASNKQLVDAVFSHPYIATTKDSLIFFTHNGRVETLGTSESEVDSELCLKAIVDRGVKGGVEHLKKIMQTGDMLNLIIMVIDRKDKKASIKYLNYHKFVEESDIKYAEMFRTELAHGHAVFSSTLLDYGMKGESVDFEKLQEL